MDTAAISYRVADFLKNHPPFHVMEQEDLLKLAQRGRVKFFEPNQYVLTGGSSGFNVYVIQQGTVLLWDERGGEAKLLDVRGAGDMLGIHLDNVRPSPYSARSASDVLIYAFPAEEFETLIQKYPHAKQYVSVHGNITAVHRSSQERRGPQNVFLRQLAAEKKLPACDVRSSISEAAQCMLEAGGGSIVVLDSNQQARAVLTAQSFLKWMADGGRDAQAPATALFDDSPSTIGPDASASDAVLALGASDAGALTITSDGTPNGRVQGLVTSRDLQQVFGDQPVEILREIRRAATPNALPELNLRARSVVLRYLDNAGSPDWLTSFTSLIDAGIVKQIIAMTAPESLRACWCFCGSSGRGESLTKLAPQIVMIAGDGENESRWTDAYSRVSEMLKQCGYLPDADRPFESSFFAANVSEWRTRYNDWVSDPILKEIYRARPLFDLRPIAGQTSLWKELEVAVTSGVNREFLHVLANDCLATLPPLTFFQNVVIDEFGEETSVFRLEDSAVRPLVDVGRVFGMAAKQVFGSSTLERFALAGKLLPDRVSIFQEASEAMRIVLWQQGRVGISQGTSGAELPPALLGRYDRQVLRSAFRSISQLLEFTSNLDWLNNL